VTAPALPEGPPRRRPVLAVALTALAAFFALAAIVLVIGRHSASAAVSVRRILAGPGPGRLFVPGPVTPPFRSFVFGPQFSGQHNGLFPLLVLLMFLMVLTGLCLAVLYWCPWSRRRIQATARAIGRTKWPEGSSR
jgi:hypothetical protein